MFLLKTYWFLVSEHSQFIKTGDQTCSTPFDVFLALALSFGLPFTPSCLTSPSIILATAQSTPRTKDKTIIVLDLDAPNPSSTCAEIYEIYEDDKSLLHFYKYIFSISITAAAHCGALSNPKRHDNNSG